MSYVGGKARRSSFILDLINSPTFDGWHYVEPFCGYCNVVRRVVNKKTLAASDCHPLLCSLLRAVQAGAPLPSHITRERYYQLKTSGGDSVERAAACFGFSFNGKAWGGYTSSYTRPGGKTEDIWATRRRYYQRLCGSPGFAASTLTQADYRTAIGTSAATVTPQTTLIFLDPPYANTTGYGGTPRFDSAALWQTAREWSRRGRWCSSASTTRLPTLPQWQHKANRARLLGETSKPPVPSGFLHTPPVFRASLLATSWVSRVALLP